MLKTTTNKPEGQVREVTLWLDELAREGARRTIAVALEIEVEHYAESLRYLRDEQGPAIVVRIGRSHHERKVQLGAGPARAFKLLLGAEGRCRRLNAPQLVTLLRAGVEFPDGQAQMFQSLRPDDDLPFHPSSSKLAASEMLVHNI